MYLEIKSLDDLDNYLLANQLLNSQPQICITDGQLMYVGHLVGYDKRRVKIRLVGGKFQFIQYPFEIQEAE